LGSSSEVLAEGVECADFDALSTLEFEASGAGEAGGGVDDGCGAGTVVETEITTFIVSGNAGQTVTCVNVVGGAVDVSINTDTVVEVVSWEASCAGQTTEDLAIGVYD